jgi:glycosyltransferase involved in cell wall biosynthesis
VVVPSTWPDSQPLIILESLLAHTPVVATNVGGIPEILPNKFICEPDSHSLAQCLKWTISLPSNILNEEVSILISFIKKNYSLSNTQNKINEIIKSSL